MSNDTKTTRRGFFKHGTVAVGTMAIGSGTEPPSVPPQTRGSGRPNILVIKDYGKKPTRVTFRVETDIVVEESDGSANKIKKLVDEFSKDTPNYGNIKDLVEKEIDDIDKTYLGARAKKMFLAAFGM